jgi:hypothetical protein
MKQRIIELLASVNLTPEDAKKVFRGLLIAIISAALTYISEWASNHDFGSYTPIVMGLWGVVVNIIRKMIDDPIQKVTGLRI